MKRPAVCAFGIVAAIFMTACSNTTVPASSSAIQSSTAPSSTVAEVQNDYVAIGGKTPYEMLTATEEQAIKKAEEERLQAEAKAKADAEAKAKAQAQAQAQQAEVQQEQVAEQPQQDNKDYDYITIGPDGKEHKMINSWNPNSSAYQAWQRLPRDENGAVILPNISSNSNN